jgi:DNA-binding beta-propeller fold protein YncE
MEMPDAVDIIDTASLSNIKTVPVDGAIHNVYATPDGRYAVAGSIQRSMINVIDTRTDELAWTLSMSSGIRSMIFDTNVDGSTKNIYVQLSSCHGFAVVDFNKHEEIARIDHPVIEGEQAHWDGRQGHPLTAQAKARWQDAVVHQQGL